MIRKFTFAAASGLLFATAASSSAAEYTDFFDATLDGKATESLTVDGLTMTLATDTNFETTGAGAGISGGASDFNIDPGEVFTLSFDNGGTLTEYVALALNPGASSGVTSANITFTNTNTSVAETVSLALTPGGNTPNDLDLSLSFSAGDVISVSFSEINSGDNPEYRVQGITAVVPEPGSMLLLGMGALSVVARRRKA